MQAHSKAHTNFLRCRPAPDGSLPKKRLISSNSSSLSSILHNGGSELSTPSKSRVKSISFSSSEQNELPRHLPTTSKLQEPQHQNFCEICQRPFEDPRILPCLHTFCLNCINTLIRVDSLKFKDFDGSSSGSGNGSQRELIEFRSPKAGSSKSISTNSSDARLTCPTCKFHHTLGSGGAITLPSYNLIHNKFKPISFRQVLCDLCAFEVVATGYCTVCNKNICPLCWDSHIRQRNTSSHTIITSVKPPISKTNCAEHLDYQISMFCMTCSRKICHKCYVGQHHGHSCEHIDTLSRMYTKTIQEALVRARPVAEQALNSIEQVRSVGRKVELRSNIVHKEVEAFIEIYKQSLDEHRLTLLQQVSKSKQDKMQIVQAQQMKLERCVEETNHSIKTAEELIANGSNIEVLDLFDQVVQKLEWCIDISRDLEPRINDCIQFLPNEQVPATVNKTPLYGMITTQTVAAKNCFLITDDLQNIRVHSKVEFILEARDIDNYPLCHGGEKIIVELKYKDSTLKVIPVTVTDHRNGTYSLNFIPDTAGKLNLSVVIKSRHIKGSPFSLVVRSVHRHTGIFHCCSFCSSHGSKVASCGCGARMPGGFKGCGHGHDGHPGRRHWSCCGSVYEHSECDNITNIQ